MTATQLTVDGPTVAARTGAAADVRLRTSFLRPLAQPRLGKIIPELNGMLTGMAFPRAYARCVVDKVSAKWRLCS